MENKIRSNFIIFLIVLQLLAFSCKVKDDSQSTPVPLTEEQEQLVQELNQWLVPLGASPLALTDNELSVLDQLRYAKIIGLGEATHGTKEFFQMKHRVFQYLVENCGHKAFGFEADFGESIYFDNYITTGEGNLTELMRDRMHFWTWRTGEVRQLLEWMREYNTGKAAGDQIHYYGFDCQFTTYQPDMILEYLQRTLPALRETASPVLEEVKAISSSDYESMSEETYNDLKTQLESLQEQLISNKDLLITNSSPGKYEINKQLLNTVIQAVIVRYHAAKGISGTHSRDRFMAENAMWIADFFGQDTKITLWAHNGHVAGNDSYGGGGAMGYYLNGELGDFYRVIAFAFSKGGFTAVGRGQYGNYTGEMTHEITTDPLPGSINLLFYHASYPDFIFRLDGIPAGSQWDNWLTTPRLFLSIGAVYNGSPANYYRALDIREHYDWIIYFDTTTASDLL
jgi:erythromycin esterase